MVRLQYLTQPARPVWLLYYVWARAYRRAQRCALRPALRAL